MPTQSVASMSLTLCVDQAWTQYSSGGRTSVHDFWRQSFKRFFLSHECKHATSLRYLSDHLHPMVEFWTITPRSFVNMSCEMPHWSVEKQGREGWRANWRCCPCRSETTSGFIKETSQVYVKIVGMGPRQNEKNIVLKSNLSY